MTPKHNNILHVAAQYQQVHFIKDLLHCPSGPLLLWQGNYKGDNPLHVAAKVGSCGVVRVFIDLAKSVHWDVQNGQVDLCKELIRKPNSNKDTALHYAVRGGHTGMVKLLIEEDPQLCWWKILEKRPEVIKEGDDLGWTPLHYVACFGEVEVVRQLLQHDTSVAYDLDKAGESALHIAAFQGHINVIEELIRSCPDACAIINTKGQTALHAAVMGGRVNVVNYAVTNYSSNKPTAVVAPLDKALLILNPEVGYRAGKVHHVLKGCHGIQCYQDWVREYVKKRLDKQFVEGQPVVSITRGINTGNRDNVDSSKRSIIDLQLLVAVLIATVTFAAAFTMPGGYYDEGPYRGMPILADRPAFKAFVIFNTTAFCFSILALFLLYDPSFWGARQQVRYNTAAGCYIYFAICGLVLAFAWGTYVVLTRTIGLGIVLFVVFGCLLTMHRIGIFLDPEVGFWLPRSTLRRFVRNILFDYGIF
ncbi:ankyrin repeat-containing protein At5g02620-like [Eucalyptus grandis]|uniref:ankyrin repeat-containing protein At5g02620-like n=1 Tax=Eucalyptus grandis TaxID=71139 RepID=UPI00192EE950|nr:ankyrin repeat-containing protein At5g02620-like [Eucalyptus grandis]